MAASFSPEPAATLPRRVVTAPRPRGGAATSIAVRLVLFAVVLVSVTATGVGLLSYTRARRALEREARARLALLARDAVEDFRRDLEDRVADVTSWARLEIMRAVRFRDVDKELAEFFRQLLRGRDTYRGVACVDAAGAVVAGAGDTAAIQWSSRPARARVVPGAAGPGKGSLQIEAPVVDPDHPETPLGTLAAIVEPLRLLRTAEALVRTQSPDTALTVRATGGVTVVDTRGDGSGAPDDPRAAARLQGTATLGGITDADSPAFEVTVSEPAAVALAPVDALRTTLLRSASVAVVVASMLGALVALWIGRPIRRLTRAVQQVSATGQLELPVDLPSGGEVGVLAAAFERMLGTVSEAQADLLSQSRLAVLGEIAANVAHEVRTPLSVLKTSAQLLGRPDLPPDEHRQLSGLLSAEVDRLNRVVTDLVDLGRPRPARYRAESMRAAVERAVRFFGPTAARRGVSLYLEGASGDPLTVNGSRDQLHQVLVNLLHNALQAMPDGGRATVTAGREDGWVVVAVEDTGPGFSDVVLAHVFTRFHTTKADGTGLGLAISKRLVEEHGGRIDATNIAQGGARVTLWLPEDS